MLNRPVTVRRSQRLGRLLPDEREALHSPSPVRIPADPTPQLLHTLRGGGRRRREDAGNSAQKATKQENAELLGTEPRSDTGQQEKGTLDIGPT